MQQVDVIIIISNFLYFGQYLHIFLLLWIWNGMLPLFFSRNRNVNIYYCDPVQGRRYSHPAHIRRSIGPSSDWAIVNPKILSLWVGVLAACIVRGILWSVGTGCGNWVSSRDLEICRSNTLSFWDSDHKSKRQSFSLISFIRISSLRLCLLIIFEICLIS